MATNKRTAKRRGTTSRTAAKQVTAKKASKVGPRKKTIDAKRRKYDVAISFAGEDRHTVRTLAGKLRTAGYSVFFDEFEKARLWGSDLTVSLSQVYTHDSRFCVIFVSEHYVSKPWTNHERRSALSRALKEQGPYVLPIKLDDTDLVGFPDVIGYLDLRSTSLREVFTLLTQKLGPPQPSTSDKLPSEATSKEAVQEVLAACYRRAVFARVHAQMSVKAMFASLADCRVTLQKLVVYVQPEATQRLVAGIIGELDFLERCKLKMIQGGYDRYWDMATQINGSKQRIIAALLQLSKSADLAFALPKSITEEVFFSEEDAKAPPDGGESPLPDPRHRRHSGQAAQNKK